MRFNDDPFRNEIETLVPRRTHPTRFEGLAPVEDEASEELVYGSGAFGVEAAWVEAVDGVAPAIAGTAATALTGVKRSA